MSIDKRIVSRVAALMVAVLFGALSTALAVDTPGSAPSGSSGVVVNHVSPAAEAGVSNAPPNVKLVTAKDLGIPRNGMLIDPKRTAIVITDPQNDFLSPKGVAWGVVGESVTENGTVGNLEKLFKVGKEMGVPVFVSPHYYFPHDHNWKFEGALETLMHKIHMFDRKGELAIEGFKGSGADWLERYKPYIMGDNVVVTSPHKIYGPESNDLVLQLRKHGISKVILGGMSANLCTESHMRELIEQGFEVTVAMDATAGAKTPAGDAYKVALSNFHYIASAVVSTDDAVDGLTKAFSSKAK